MAASKAAGPAMFSPAASGMPVACDSLALVPRPVGAQRLFEPPEVEGLQLRRHGAGLVQAPGLVGVGHERQVGAQHLAHRGEVRQVALAAEADLELERAVAFGEPRRGQVLRPIGIDAAGIDAHAIVRAAQVAPQRLAGAARAQVPQREVDARDHLRHRARLAGLDREHGGALRQPVEGFGRAVEGAARQQRRHHAVDELRAVLRATGRKVAPDFAPAGGAVAVFHAHEDGRPVMHGAEGGAHGRGDRAAEHEGLDARGMDRGEGQRLHGFRFISTRMASPR